MDGGGIYRKRVSIQKLSGNEADCTNAALLLERIMLCSRFDCQKVFKLKLFSFKKGWRGRGGDRHAAGRVSAFEGSHHPTPEV